MKDKLHRHQTIKQPVCQCHRIIFTISSQLHRPAVRTNDDVMMTLAGEL